MTQVARYCGNEQLVLFCGCSLFLFSYSFVGSIMCNAWLQNYSTCVSYRTNSAGACLSN